MKKISFALLLLISVAITAQNSNLKPFIEVTGIAKTEIVPDEIYLDICIKERIEKGKKLTITILENQLKSTLKTIGIPEENLSISDVNNILSKTGLWKKELLSSTNYTLKVEGVNNLKNLFKSFKKQKVFSVNIIKVSHSNIIELKKKNRIKAISAAKEKADYLLLAIGEETGSPIIIKEIDISYKDNNRNSNIRIRGYNSNYEQYSPISIQGYGIKNNRSMEFEKIKITSSIYVKFLIK
jgi:uncharacterized protein YggE